MDTKEIKEIEALGFTTIAKELTAEQEFNRKTAEAYLQFKIVRQEHIENFNKELKKKTLRELGTAGRDLYHEYETLKLQDIRQYPSLPPAEVLGKLKEAQKLNIFDYYEIMKIESVQEYKDPILFGCINGCPDKFFIAEWDQDIKLADLIGE